MATQLKLDTYEVTLSGRFTFSDHTAFREIIFKIDDKDVKQVVLEMSRVEFVDSAALGMLLLACEAAQKLQKQIILSSAIRPKYGVPTERRQIIPTTR